MQGTPLQQAPLQQALKTDLFEGSGKSVLFMLFIMKTTAAASSNLFRSLVTSHPPPHN